MHIPGIKLTLASGFFTTAPPGKPMHLYVYVYKSFSAALDKGLRNNIQKIRRRRRDEKWENINSMRWDSERN